MSAAFELKIVDGAPEPYLSVYWLEYLGEDGPEDQVASLREFLETSNCDEPTRRPAGRFARLNVGQMRKDVADAVPTHRLTARHEHRGIQDIDPHSGIHGLYKDEDEQMITAVLADLSDPYLAV